MASSQEVSLLLSQRLFYNAWLTTAAGRIDTGGIVLFICSTKMHEFGSKVMCETTFTATQCGALSRWVWFKGGWKRWGDWEDLEPAEAVGGNNADSDIEKLMNFSACRQLVHIKKYWGWVANEFGFVLPLMHPFQPQGFLFEWQLSSKRKRFGLLQLFSDYVRQRSETFFNHPVVP